MKDSHSIRQQIWLHKLEENEWQLWPNLPTLTVTHLHVRTTSRHDTQCTYAVQVIAAVRWQFSTRCFWTQSTFRRCAWTECRSARAAAACRPPSPTARWSRRHPRCPCARTAAGIVRAVRSRSCCRRGRVESRASSHSGPSSSSSSCSTWSAGSAASTNLPVLAELAISAGRLRHGCHSLDCTRATHTDDR